VREAKEFSMTLTLELSPELEQRLFAAAQARGLPPGEWALRLLDASLSASERRRKDALAMLREWRGEEVTEREREEYEEFLRALDEDRPSDRKLFPPELKGISW
jgi:hypothetical protein